MNYKETRKKWVSLSLVAALLVGMVSGLMAQEGQLQKTYNEAKAAYAAGDYAKAAAGFRKVLKYQPGFVYARKYLTMTEAKIKEGAKPTASLESKLAQIQVPSVEFSDTDLGAVLTYLAQKSSELSGGKVVANFIYQGTSEDKNSKRVTLKLSNVPMTEVIRYVGQLTGTRFKYEQFAVVGTPLSALRVKETPTPALSDKRDAAATFDNPKDPFAK